MNASSVEQADNWSKRRIIVVSMMLMIAAAHIVNIRSFLPAQFSPLYASYFSDFILPFGTYFLLRLPEREMPVLRRWQVKLALAFGLPALAETCQYFGIWALGVTFDPLDYVAYAAGALTAALVDRLVFPRFWGFW